MLTRDESQQLNNYSEKDPYLKTLLHRLEEEHRSEVSRISHEIRNPVTLINSYLQLTEHHYPQVADYSTWKPIMENMEYLKTLLEDLSHYNHAGVLHPETFSLPQLLKDICRDAAAAWFPIHIVFHQRTAVPTAWADKTKLKEAVLNLIRNGAEALENRPNGKIILSLTVVENCFLIQVSNNGPQIRPEHMKDMFEPFVSHKKDGTGLGLSIVRSIAMAHGGSISATSIPDETCFRLKIPIVSSMEEAACAHVGKEEA